MRELTPRLWLGWARGIAALAVLGYFAVVLLEGGHPAFVRLGIPPMGEVGAPLSFGDLRSITSAWDCIHHHVHVFPQNPCDPWGRPYSYPRLWLVGASLGLGTGQNFLFGCLIGAAFLLAAIAVLPRRAPAWHGIVFAAALCSPAVMLGVERANVDLVTFPLLVVAAYVFRRGIAGLATACGLILLGGALKLAPFLGLAVLARRRDRQALVVGGGTLVVLLAYVALTWGDLRAIAHFAPQSDDVSFGVRRLTDWLAVVHGAPLGQTGLRVTDLALAGIALAVALVLKEALPAGEADDPRARLDRDLFVIGAAIYAASYVLFLSFDYRLIFVLLTLPQLLRWAGERRALAIGTLAALLGTFWLEPDWTGVPVLGGTLSAWASATERLSGAPQPLPLVVVMQALLFVGLLAGLFRLVATKLEVDVPQLGADPAA